MMIVDAIRSAATPHAVSFLVTAYIESLRHFERSCGVPPAVLALPLDGPADLEQRVRMLHQHTRARETVVPVGELAAVLDCAIERLAALGASPPIMQHGRIDNLRSALSV